MILNGLKALRAVEFVAVIGLPRLAVDLLVEDDSFAQRQAPDRARSIGWSFYCAALAQRSRPLLRTDQGLSLSKTEMRFQRRPSCSRNRGSDILAVHHIAAQLIGSE